GLCRAGSLVAAARFHGTGRVVVPRAAVAGTRDGARAPTVRTAWPATAGRQRGVASSAHELAARFAARDARISLRDQPRRGDRQSASIRLLGDRIVGESMPACHDLDNGVTAVRMLHDVPSWQAAPDAAGDKIVPITRARRTLH